MGAFWESTILSAIATATAMTGGALAMPGEVVVTGSQSASAQVVNIINANDSGGYSKTIITIESDGEKKTEVKEKTFSPGESVSVLVVASSSAPKAISAIKGERGTASSTHFASSTPSSSPLVPVALSKFKAVGSQIASVFSSLFGGFFSFFWFR